MWEDTEKVHITSAAMLLIQIIPSGKQTENTFTRNPDNPGLHAQIMGDPNLNQG